MNICPRCGGKDFWHLSTGQSRCKRCRLTRKLGRPLWECARIPSCWKERLLEYFCLAIPAYRLRSVVPLNPKSVRRWFRLMREAIYQQQVKRLSVLPANIIGQAMVPMFSASVEPGWIPILDGRVFIGLWQMDGKVFTCLLPDSTDEVILSSMGEHSKSKIFPGVKLGYACLPLEIRGQHVVFKKNRKGNAGHAEASTDGIGAFWSLAKQFFSQHRTIPVRLFPLYLKEMEWRYNHRTENLVILLRNLLRQLTIDDLRDSSGLCTDENLNYSARAARSYSADKDPGSAPMLYH